LIINHKEVIPENLAIEEVGAPVQEEPGALAVGPEQMVDDALWGTGRLVPHHRPARRLAPEKGVDSVALGHAVEATAQNAGTLVLPCGPERFGNIPRPPVQQGGHGTESTVAQLVRRGGVVDRQGAASAVEVPEGLCCSVSTKYLAFPDGRLVKLLPLLVETDDNLAGLGVLPEFILPNQANSAGMARTNEQERTGKGRWSMHPTQHLTFGQRVGNDRIARAVAKSQARDEAR
jgi:hypothetical protein